MMDKYRVHEVAKDLGVPNKDILALLNQYFPDDQRKHMTALSDAELNLVFDHYTQKSSLKSLDNYFALSQQAKAATPAPEPVSVKTPIDAPQPKAAAPAPQQQPQQQPQRPVQGQNQNRPAQFNNNNRQSRPGQLHSQQSGQRPLHAGQQQRPQQQQQRPVQQPVQAQPQGQQTPSNKVERPASRHVDMRSAQVNLHK